MMPLKTEQPGPCVRQISGKDPEGRLILSVIVRRTYQISDRGECILSEKQLPLQDAPEFAPDGERLLKDFDLYAYKPRTDVVVKGHAYAYMKERQLTAAVHVGEVSKKILVLGDRRCTRSGAGIAISPPAPMEKIPLAYSHAYGGRDVYAEAAAMKEFEKLGARAITDLPPKGETSPYLYPRNPSGRGYLLKADPGAIEALNMPNLEDPLDPLTPARLLAGSQMMWPRMPLPQATDWVAYSWFPRVSGLGIAPPHDRTAQPFAEITRGLVPERVIKPPNRESIDAFHLTCGASLGLQFSYFRGGEIVTLEHIHPKQALFRFALPREHPKIWTDGRKGKFNKTDPVIHTVVIEPDEARVSIVWRGSAPALRPYMPQELEKMPLRVEW